MSVNVESIERIETLAAALERFAARAESALAAAEAEMRRAAAELEDRARHCEAEVAHWRDALDDADDEEDDVEGLEMHLGAAEARLDRVRDLQSDLEAQCASFRAEIAPLRRLAADGLPGASEELGRLVDALYGIRAVQPPGTLADPAAAPVAQAPATSSSPSAVEPAAYDGTAQPLPRGFVWVPIDEIRSRELRELPTRAEFRNIAYDEVVRGFETLRRSVLPAIRPGGGVDPSLEAGWGAADLAADPHNIFQGFFGSEQIHLSRRAGMKYGIVNGRHRIRVALDLGWTAIPASIDEVE